MDDCFIGQFPGPAICIPAAPDVHEGLGQIQALTMYPQTINNNDDNDALNVFVPGADSVDQTLDEPPSLRFRGGRGIFCFFCIKNPSRLP